MSLKERQRNIQNRKLHCVELLETIAAEFVVNLTLPSFKEDLCYARNLSATVSLNLSVIINLVQCSALCRMNVDFARVITTREGAYFVAYSGTVR